MDANPLPSLEQVRAMLEDLAGGGERGEVATWAAGYVAAHAAGGAASTDPVVWRALVRMAGADLTSSPGVWLHPRADVLAWLREVQVELPARREWQLHGELVWLTPAQGGRPSGPPDGEHYTGVVLVPPGGSAGTGRLVMRLSQVGSWRAQVQGRWGGSQRPHVQAGLVLVVMEGERAVGYLHVQQASD